MALEVADIIPWKWDLERRMILCDINRPIELSTEEQDVTEEQLSVPDAQYFAKIFREDRPRIEKAYQDLITGTIKKVKEEYRVVTRTATGLQTDWVEAQATVATRDENGRPLTLVGSSLVITARKALGIGKCQGPCRGIESPEECLPCQYEPRDTHAAECDCRFFRTITYRRGTGRKRRVYYDHRKQQQAAVATGGRHPRLVQNRIGHT